MSRDWFERFGALQVEVHTTQANDDVTVLQGRVIDQAQLSGILNTLYELHMSLLAVKYLGDKSSSN